MTFVDKTWGFRVVSPSLDLILEGSPGLDQLVLCEIVLTGCWCGASQIPAK